MAKVPQRASRPRRRLFWQAALAGLWLSAGAQAGDPIEFSSNSRKVEAPKSNPLEQYLNRPFESLKPGNSLGPVVGPLAPLRTHPPPMLPDKDEREKGDWKNSWIFALPENANRQPSVEEIFKVPQIGPDGRPAKKRSLMEEYFQRRLEDARPEARKGEARGEANPRADNERDRDEFDHPGGAGRSGNRPDSKPLFAPGWGDSGGAQSGENRGPLARGGDLTLSDLFSDAREQARRERDRELRTREFQQMLDNRNFSTLPDKGPGLIDPLGNAARLEALPSAMRDLELSRPARRDVLSAGAPALGGTRGSGGLLDEPARLQLGAAGPAKPPETRSPLPERERPMVLPVPKPKF